MVVKLFSCLSRIVPKDVRLTQKALRETLKYGSQAGRRCARIHNKGKAASIFAQATSVKRNIKFGHDDIPAVAAISSSLVPLPGSIFVGYGLGKAIKIILKYCGK